MFLLPLKVGSSDDDDERRREKDLRERDEFAQRLKTKDKDRTRNLAEKSDKKAFEEARKRLQMEEKDKKSLIPNLRERARKDYVEKRTREKVDSLREGIREDERMFDQSSLTEKEKLQMHYNKKVCS